MPLTLDQLNTAPMAAVLQQLDGLYEHSPWIASQALQQRPFAPLAHFKHALAKTVTDAGLDAQLAARPPEGQWLTRTSPPGPLALEGSGAEEPRPSSAPTSGRRARSSACLARSAATC